MTVHYEAPLDKPDYIIQSNYYNCCAFWPFVNEEGTYEDNKDNAFDVGVWRITYKHN